MAAGWWVFERSDVVCSQDEFLINGICQPSGIDELRERVDELERELLTLETSSGDLASRLEGARGRHGRLEEQLAAQRERTLELESDLVQYEECILAHSDAHSAAFGVLQNGDPEHFYYGALERVQQECEGVLN